MHHLCVCGHVGINKSIVLPASEKCITCNYASYVILVNDNRIPYYHFIWSLLYFIIILMCVLPLTKTSNYKAVLGGPQETFWKAVLALQEMAPPLYCCPEVVPGIQAVEQEDNDNDAPEGVQAYMNSVCVSQFSKRKF